MNYIAVCTPARDQVHTNYTYCMVNMVGAFKAGQDGLADAWKINDKRIDCTYKVSDQVSGMVKVKLLGEKP